MWSNVILHGAITFCNNHCQIFFYGNVTENDILIWHLFCDVYYKEEKEETYVLMKNVMAMTMTMTMMIQDQNRAR